MKLEPMVRVRCENCGAVLFEKEKANINTLLWQDVTNAENLIKEF